jgi:DNA-binding NarL/FixJ family response regulator
VYYLFSGETNNFNLFLNYTTFVVLHIPIYWYSFDGFLYCKFILENRKLINVVIADTSFLIRKGLKTIINETSDFNYQAEVADASSLKTVLQNNDPDVLIVDHCCDDCFSLETISDIKKNYPTLNILVISHEKTATEIKKIISIGIKNYLLKDCDEHEIIDAIRSCANDKKYFCSQIIDVLLEREIEKNKTCETGGVTERELDVIKELVSGKRPKEIVDILNISYNTIITHKKNVYKKLGINNPVELMQYALNTGIIPKS